MQEADRTQVRLHAAGRGPLALALIRQDGQAWLGMKQVWDKLCSHEKPWKTFYNKASKGDYYMLSCLSQSCLLVVQIS